MNDSLLPNFIIPILFPLRIKQATLWKPSMEMLSSLHRMNFYNTLHLLLPPLLSSLLLLPSAGQSDIPDTYFINCGSDSTNTAFGKDRVFVGDVDYHGSLDINPGKSRVVKETSMSETTGPEPVNQTARVFSSPTWYVFSINNSGKYIVRLHFYALSSLAKARFSVSVPDHELLSNFTAQQNTSVREFLLDISKGRFGFYFEPSGKPSLAFVNAIEVINASELFIPKNAYKVTPESTSNDILYYSLLGKTLKPLYRINVGGDMLTQDNDTLWRNWEPDDEYLLNPAAAKKSPSFSGTIEYGVGLTALVAPTFVYNSAKELNSNFSNITWGFKVSKNTTYYVRIHFCDVISKVLGQLQFIFFIYKKFSFTINPEERSAYRLAAPFYYDMAVVSDDSGFLNMGIGLGNDSIDHNAFLNGIEIMELIRKADKVLLIKEEPKKNKSNYHLIVGLVVTGLASMVVFMVAFFMYFARGRKGKPSHDLLSLDPNLHLELKISFKEIERATNNFDENLVLGQGGFGKVYKGTIGGQAVAVKRSVGAAHGQGFTEFENEVKILSRIRYLHLVFLFGYCDDKSEMILVYEFMENGTLRDVLYHENKDGSFERKSSRSEFSWKKRLDICIDAAKGLDYLHTGPSEKIIHRDVKTTNILLNKDNVGKVADFGLSKLSLVDLEDEHATGPKGTCGYFDPEYFNTAQLTDKSDVYSFGVVLLEVLSARPAILRNGSGKEVNLADWAKYCHKTGQVNKLIDPMLIDTISPASLSKFLDTALKCLKESGLERPKMNDVVWDLTYALQLQENAMVRDGKDDSTITLTMAMDHSSMSSSYNLSQNGNGSTSDANASSSFF